MTSETSQNEETTQTTTPVGESAVDSASGVSEISTSNLAQGTDSTTESQPEVKAEEKAVEVPKAVETTVKPRIPQLTPREKIAPKVEEKTTVSVLTEAVKEPELSSFLYVIESDLNSYETQMQARKSIDNANINRNQVAFFRTISRVINSPTEFREAYTLLLRHVKENKTGAYDETRILRGMDYVTLTATERKAFVKFVNLLLATADPALRAAALAQIDFELTLKYGVTDQGRQNILNFYQV